MESKKTKSETQANEKIKPIYELTEKEWNNLSFGEKPIACTGIPYLAHNLFSPDYYFYALKHRIVHGSKISRRIWDSLSTEKQSWLEKQTNKKDYDFVELVPIHHLTEAEWDSLRWYEQKKYKDFREGYDFYINTLEQHVINNGKLTKRIWESLTIHQQQKLILAFADTNEDFFKSLCVEANGLSDLECNYENMMR